MIIGSKQKISHIETDSHVSINNQVINRAGNTKTLGVFTDENISWKTRIEHAKKSPKE